MSRKITVRKVLDNLERRHIFGIVLSVLLSSIAIGYIGYVLYSTTQSELELRGEMDVIQSADKFNDYLAVDRNALTVAKAAVNNMLVHKSPNDEILAYMVEQSNVMMDEVDASFTGFYGWIGGEYLDGAGWVPDNDFVPVERPWYKAAMASPNEIVFVDPYVDEHTGNVMMTMAALLDDGESIIALDIGLGGVQNITDEIAADTLGAKVMVFDNGNTAIAHSDAGKVGQDYSRRQDTLEGRIIEHIQIQDDEQFAVNAEGQEYMVYAKQLDGGWHCVSAIDTDMFYSPLKLVIAFTSVLGATALLLVIVIFYRVSRRELANKNLHVQIRAATDIYVSILDIILPEDAYYDINRHLKTGQTNPQLPNAQEALFKRVEDLVAESSRPYLMEFLDLSTIDRRLKDTDVITVEFLDYKYIWCRGKIICAERAPEGEVMRILWSVEIIDEEKRQKERLQHLAETDPLTKIYNRAAGEYKIRELLGNGKEGMFVLFDIDGFKMFNDRFGHDVGDRVIIAVANCMKNAFREDDIVMRLGGDEFAAFAIGVGSEEIGKRILARFYDNLGNVVIDDLAAVKIYVSAGIAFSSDFEEPTFPELYKLSDQLMYETKKASGHSTTAEGKDGSERREDEPLS